MKQFLQLVSSRQNLHSSSHKFFGGLVLTSLLSLFLSLFLDTSAPSAFPLETCDNVTFGGTIGENQSQCNAYDPEVIFNLSNPSGGSGTIEYLWLKTTDCSKPVDEWDQIPGVNDASYDPGLITETTCFIRCSRRAGCVDYDGESNIVTLEVLNDCPPEDWEFACGQGKTVELVGKGIKNNVPVTLDFANSSTIYQVVVEIVYKGGNPGNSISVFDEFGIPYLAYREQPVGGSSNVYVYRTTLPATSSVSYQNQNQENKAQSIVAYLFRNDQSASQSSGYFTHISGYHDVQTLNFTIPADVAPRNIEIELPVSEMTPDCRILNITATAGAVSETITIDGPDDDLGCCLNIAHLTLNNVSGDVTNLEIEVESPSGSGSGCPSTPNHNGQSYVIAGAVKVDVECICPLAEINLSAQDHCVDNPSVFSAENIGDEYDYSWDFGINAQPQTATGLGPHFVSYLTTGTQTISLSVNNDTCSASTVIQTINVSDCEDTQCGLISVTVNSDSDCYDATGTLDVEICETCGTQYPITVFYTFNGIPQQAGPFDTDGPILTDLPAGFYTDIYIQDETGCTSNHVGPVVIAATGDTGTLSDETCGNTECTITGYNGNEGQRAFWIPGLPEVTNVRYNFDTNNGALEVYDDGTARLTGRIINLDDPSCGFEVDFLFENKRNWTEWSALGRSWKGNPAIVGNLYETWDYYEIQDGSTLTGFGCFNGTLNISHKPANYNFGVQIGQAANAKNELPGISAWFFYQGNLNGEEVSGSGDINAEGACGTGDPGDGADPETPILSCPPCISLDCNSSLDPEENSELEVPFVNCTESYTLTYEDSQTGTCPVIITRTWTATGPEGTATCTQEITLLDTTAPVITNVPADTTVECDAIPVPGTPSLADDCDTNSQLTFTEVSTQTNNGTCSDHAYTIIRTWTATDVCGNESTASQAIFVEDNTPPVFSGIPADITLSALPVPVVAAPTATDNCGGNVTIEFEEISGSGCSYTITRTWTATDLCGNQDVASQTIYVELNPEAGTLTIDDQLSCLAPAGNGTVSATPDGNAVIPTGFETIFILTDENTGIIEQINATPNFTIPSAGSYAIHTLIYINDPSDVNYLDISAIQIGADQISAIVSQLEQGGGSLCGALDGSGASVIVDNCNATIGDYVWEDKNGNGIQDDGEPGVENSPVSLVGMDITGADVFFTGSTSTDGFYSFDNLPPGEYKITFGTLPGFVLTFQDEGSDDEKDSDADPLNGMTEFVMLNSGETNNSVDAGLYATVTIGDFAWLDCNKNGIQDAGEAGLADVPVSLSGVNGIGNPVDLNTSTDVNGFYEFVNLKPGTYFLTFGFPANPTGLAYTQMDQTSDDLDSDVDETNGETTEETYQSGDTNNDIDAGFYDAANPELAGVPADITVECDAIPAPPTIDVDITANDNVDTNVEIVFSELSTQGNGDSCSFFNYTITRIWTAYDDCGNESSDSQTITVEDTTSPVFSGIPANLTVSCDDIPQAANPTATDNCDDDLNIVYSENRIDGSCTDSYTLVREWRVWDACGNETVENQTISVEDITAPTISGIPADITVECDAIPSAASPTATDNCDTNVDVTYEEVRTDGNCAENYTLTRSWTATDNCGNQKIQTQVITVLDTQEPSLSGVPVDITVECDAIPSAAPPTATDNCDTNVEIIYEEVRTDGSCAENYTLTRSWTATDNCGNQEIQTQVITVLDTHKPSLSGVPADVTVECDAIPAAASPTATDNCDTNVEITYEEVRTDGDCAENYTLTRSWTATDNCGNQEIQTQIITVEDNTAPELAGVPADFTVNCDFIPPPAEPIVNDNCDVDVELEFNEIRTDGPCTDAYSLLRTWTATDNCGNQTSESQTIVVLDESAPQLAGVPADVTVECDAIPAAASPTATDNCDTNIEINYSESRTDGNCSEAYVLTRTWTATDNCGNQDVQTQIIIVEDTTDPVLAGVPADVTVECDAIPSAASPTATDNCDISVEITYDESQTDGDCVDHYTLTRTWTAIDNCGNSVSQSQVITIEDSSNPVLAGIPSDITVECNAVPAPAQPTATDNCDIDVEVALNESIIPGNCPDTYTLVRTWTATDNCGNTTEDQQIITVLDTQGPILSGTPSDITVECNAIPEAPAIGIQITATDNCDDDVLIGFYENIVPGPCEDRYSIVRSWIATDNCGNTAEASQVIAVEDTQDPLLTGVPADLTIECDAIPQAASPTATDNCDTNVEIDFNETRIDGNCSDNYVLTRTWTATDNCGNSVSQSQIITIEDTTNPTLSGIPANETVDCNEIPVAASPVATDNCDTDVDLSFTETETAGPCTGSYIITRTWTATDNCGNFVSQSQIISVEDATAPVLSGVPSDVTVECDNIPDAVNVTATDNCDTNVEVEVSELILDGDCTDSYVIKRTYTATDNCGNSSAVTRLITVEDTTDPVLTEVPANITVECDAVPGASMLTATDNCDTDVEILFVENRIDGPCEDTYTLIRTWTAIDNCGNQDIQIQKIEVEDTTPPSLSGIPANITVECDAVPAPPANDALAVTDNCDVDVEIFFSESLLDNDCPDNYTIIRTWTAIDNCGNETSQEQEITVEDTTAPVLSGVPANVNAACDAIPEVPQIGVDITATDNCDINVLITFDELITPGDCNDSYIITRTWTATDNCGNVSEASQVITVGDDAPPVLSGVPSDVTVACGNIPTPANPVASDSCDDNVAIEFEETTINGPCQDNYTIIRTWTAIDNCGNATSETQNITVEDTENPTLSSAPVDITVECGNIPPPPAIDDFTATDNCDTNVDISFNEAIIPGSCQDSYTLVRTWTATDNCGNTTENQQFISVIDTNEPVLTGVPTDITVECDNIPAPPVIGIDILATDNCDSNVEIALFENIVPGPCTDTYQIVRSWFATDNCGNLAEAFQIINVQDTTDPELLGVPADITLNPGEPVPAPANVLATDNCDDNVEIIFTETEEIDGCMTTITRTWEAIDNCGNSVQESQIIIGLDILNVTITPDNPMVCAGDEIEFSSNQADTSYTYNWTSTGGNFDDLTALNPVYTNTVPGTYEITLSVSSGAGCEGSATTMVTILEEPVASAASNSPVCEGADILLSASGGNSYFWTGPNGFTSFEQNPLIENASLADAGVYTVMVMLGDCGNEASVEVVVTEGITADFNVVDADCDNPGSINIGAIGGSGVYTYDWADLPGNNDPEDRDGLEPGTYSVTIYDGGGCTFEINEIIVGDNCGCTATAGGIGIDADVACLENGLAEIFGFPDGTAVVPPGYTMVYLLSNGFGLTIIDLKAIPEFTVTESGVYAIHPFVYNPATFNINIIQFGATNIFDIHFLLQQGGGTICGSLNIPGASITVSEAFATVEATGPADCDLCNGSASLSPGNYLYQWSDGGNGPDRDNLCAGNYEITATDTNTGCTDILNLIIEEDCECIDPVVENIQVFAADCGVANGAINITMEGDEADYSYVWWPNIGSANSIGNNRAELIAGVYSITITDLDMPDCSTVIEVTVENNGGPQNLEISTTEASCGESNGSATILPADYTYVWIFDQLESNSRDDLAPGTYQVVAIDPAVPDCPQFITIEILEDNPLQAEVQIISPPTCNEADGIVKINVSGATGLPSFSWSDNPALNTEFRTDLAAGPYIVTVTDTETGCEVIVDFNLTGNNGEAIIEITNLPSLLCDGDSLGVVEYSVEYSPDFELPTTEIIQDSDGNTVTNGQLSAGTYCILITDANGCPGGQACFDVTEPDALTADISIENADCQQGGFIDIDVSGGVGAYTYNWSDLPGTDDPQDRDDLLAGNYSVTVTDENGCELILNDLAVGDDCLDCTAAAGGITADSNPACLQNGSVLLSATPDGTAVVPAGYVTVYLLSNGPGLTIIDINGNPQFTVTNTGSYAIHPLVINPATFDISTIIFGSTTIFDVHFMLQQGGGTICGGLNIPGASIFVTETIANIENIIPDECEACNGEVTLSPFNYLYEWSDGGNGPSRINLCDGTYQVTATDPNTGCEDVLTVIVGDLCDPACPNPDTIYTVLTIFSETTECVEIEDCFAADETNFMLLDGNVIGNSAFGNWNLQNGGCLTYEAEGIPGDFVDTICVVAEYAGLLDTTCIIVSITDQPLNTPEIDTIYLTTLEETAIDTCLTLDELNGNFASNELYYGPVNGTGILELDPNDPCLTFTPNPGATGDFIDTLGIIICDDLGFCDTTIAIISILPQTLCQDLYSGPNSLTIDDCSALAPVCLDIPLGDVLNYTVSDNGLPYLEGYLGCNYDSLVTYLAFGFSDGQPYSLEWTVNGAVLTVSSFNNLQELVDTMNVLDPGANWELSGVLIAGGNFDNVYGDMIVSLNGTVITTASPAVQLVPGGISIQLDTGFHEVILMDTVTGCIDTFAVTINCGQVTGMSTDTMLVIYEGMTDTLCLDVSGLNATSITNLCPDDSDGNVAFDLIPGTACFEYSGEILGLDTFCLEVCDSTLNICDTTNVIIEVIPDPDTIETEILLGFSDSLCLDTSIFANDIGVFFNYCFTAEGPFIEYELDEDNYCVYYTGIDLGTDTLCMVLCDLMGACDTTVLIVNVTPLTTDTIFTSVVVAETDTICLDTTELAGNIESISNICTNLSGTFVDFDILDDYCVSFEGLLSGGTDTACLVICDEFGFCDTTIIVTTVIENPLIEPPVAVDDDTMGLAATATEIPVLLNDTLNSILIDIGIVDGPENGSVVINPDFTMTYLPDPDFCGAVDSFSYFIATEGGTDTATVYIDVLCQDLTVFSGMSPNGDGINDYFAILGIETFPENTVYIFNRWGNQVFEKENYSNDDPWFGTWKGRNLPDGTYFYLIEAKNEEGKVVKLNGYIQIHR